LLVHYSHATSMDQRPFDQVLLIRIQAFPRQKARQAMGSGNLAGWRAALLGPFDAMMQVRSASQTERGDLEINLLTRATLAEVKAARERTEREFQSALAEVEQLELLREQLFERSADEGSIPAESARQYLAVRDKLDVAEAMLTQARDRRRRTHDLFVESVVFDFQPVDHVRIPMSWKLTTKQKRQLDHSWDLLVQGRLPYQPLEVLDRYFDRVQSDRRTSPSTLEAATQSSRPRASSGQISASRPSRIP
jgi:hypothetical protein